MSGVLNQEMLFEIRWLGRGGQGVVLVNQILGISCLKEQKFVQAFPEFGPERSGAPVRGYTRISDSYIDDHSPISDPDYVIVIDPTLALTPGAYGGLKEGGIAVLNSAKNPDDVRRVCNLPNAKICIVNAREISDRIFKTQRPIYNTAMLGALMKALGFPKLESVQSALAERFSGILLESNVTAVKTGYDEVKII